MDATKPHYQSKKPATNNFIVEQLDAEILRRTKCSTRPIDSAIDEGNAGQEQIALWLGTQVTNAVRHATNLRPFKKGEFGEGVNAPTEAHRKAVNHLMQSLRQHVFNFAKKLSQSKQLALKDLSRRELQRFVAQKELGGRWTKSTELIWDFYFEIFSQRQSQVANYLGACDKIAADCYRVAYMGLGRARSIPSPAPITFFDTQRSPATYRRHVLVTKIGKLPNPFPLVKLPLHRLINPWTLGAISHEVGHNLQSDLGLWHVLPKAINRRLKEWRLPPLVVNTWTRWHKEIFADLAGLLLIGPQFVGSLMDVVGRTTKRTVYFNPKGVHPVPYLRVFINLELLKRLGFKSEARAYAQMWNRLYPANVATRLPNELVDTFKIANRLAVDIVCFQPYFQLGNKRLVDVIPFGKKEHTLVNEASKRLALGEDPGILPERFLISAARIALQNNLARPEVIKDNFYKAITRR